MELDKVDLLSNMLRAREGGRREAILFRQGKSWMQISSHGHEALLALSYLLQEEDVLAPYYRSGHMCIGKGASQYELACDFLAKEASSSGGRSVSVHFSSREKGIFPGLAPTGSHCPAAAGIAWAQKLRKGNAITLCTIGDGATREGAFYEAVAFAVQESLPVIFLVEDNGYAISTPTRDMNPFHLGLLGRSLSHRFDGRSADSVYEVGMRAIRKARVGDGPSILWADVDRIDSHTVIEDQRKYRDPAALDQFVDPVDRFARELMRQGLLDEGRWTALQEQIGEEVKATYKAAQSLQAASPQDIFTHLYADKVCEYRDYPAQPAPVPAEMTMIAAINQTLSSALAEFPEVMLFGQDIEDPKGGVFGFTATLSSKFPGRVVNAPVAETAILGAATGMAAMGYKPVFEIQFIDFLAPAFDQLVNQISSLRWRTAGNWSCPMVLYAPYGAYLPAGGLWHSQSNEGWWTHIPGLRVAVPSTPEDAAGLFWAAIQDDDPSLILVPKHIMQKSLPMRRGEALPFGRAKVEQPGTDVTLVAWGNCVSLAMEAANAVRESHGASCEVIDLRTLVPWDAHTVKESLRKTGRIVVVQEDSLTSSFGTTVVSHIVADPKAFEYLLSAPRLVSRGDVHIPYHPQLEEAVLPGVDDVIAAIVATLDE
jgi:2-oxoisovalerate dehydrogenase E1 component